MAKKKRKSEEKIGFSTELLPCALTGDELLEKGQALARVHKEIGEHEMHADAVKSQLKTRRAELDAKAAELAGVIQRKAELRPVSVTHWALWDTGHYQEVREDTGEVLPGTFRPLREDERQGMLFDEAAETAKKALDAAKGEPEAKKGKKAKKDEGEPDAPPPAA